MTRKIRFTVTVSGVDELLEHFEEFDLGVESTKIEYVFEVSNPGHTGDYIEGLLASYLNAQDFKVEEMEYAWLDDA